MIKSIIISSLTIILEKIDLFKEIIIWILVLLSEIKEDKVSSNLIEYLYTKDNQKFISYFVIFPKFIEQQIKTNYTKNIKKIFSKIK